MPSYYRASRSRRTLLLLYSYYHYFMFYFEVSFILLPFLCLFIFQPNDLHFTERIGCGVIFWPGSPCARGLLCWRHPPQHAAKTCHARIPDDPFLASVDVWGCGARPLPGRVRSIPTTASGADAIRTTLIQCK